MFVIEKKTKVLYRRGFEDKVVIYSSDRDMVDDLSDRIGKGWLAFEVKRFEDKASISPETEQTIRDGVKKFYEKNQRTDAVKFVRETLVNCDLRAAYDLCMELWKEMD